MLKNERGSVLLEVMIALTLLSVGGISIVSLQSAALRSEVAMAERESTLRKADRVLAALTLLTRNDLDRRLGRHQVGRFVAEVRRPEPGLYRIAMLESERATGELLVTVVHRPQEELP